MFTFLKPQKYYPKNAGFGTLSFFGLCIPSLTRSNPSPKNRQKLGFCGPCKVYYSSAVGRNIPPSICAFGLGGHLALTGSYWIGLPKPTTFYKQQKQPVKTNSLLDKSGKPTNMFFFGHNVVKNVNVTPSHISHAINQNPSGADSNNIFTTNSSKGFTYEGGKPIPDRFNSKPNLGSKFGFPGQASNTGIPLGSKPPYPNDGRAFGAAPSKGQKNNSAGGNIFGAFSKNVKDKVVSITYEEIGLFPRSFSRVIDRFLKQIFSDVENLVIQEYRFYRYLFLTTIQTIFILLFVPLFVNFIAKTYLIRPVTEYFWNTKQTEIFLNSYEQKRAFLELQDFEEKLYFESLLTSNNSINTPITTRQIPLSNEWGRAEGTDPSLTLDQKTLTSSLILEPSTPLAESSIVSGPLHSGKKTNNRLAYGQPISEGADIIQGLDSKSDTYWLAVGQPTSISSMQYPKTYSAKGSTTEASWFTRERYSLTLDQPIPSKKVLDGTKNNALDAISKESINGGLLNGLAYNQTIASLEANGLTPAMEPKAPLNHKSSETPQGYSKTPFFGRNIVNGLNLPEGINTLPYENTGKNLLPVAQLEVLNRQSNLLQERLQEKTLELAIRYNNHSIESITNFFADFVSLLTLLYLLVSLEIQINITKSFLLEVFFGLDDSKKSLLILIMTDLLVGYHSSNLWELFFQFIFNHYGIPESQTGIFLLVATLPVLLDVLFKYLIFRHLNRASPATVATYHAIIE